MKNSPAAGQSRPVIEPLLNAADVAEVLNVSVRTVQRLAVTGELAACYIGRALRIAPADLRVYMAAIRDPAAAHPWQDHG